MTKKEFDIWAEKIITDNPKHAETLKFLVSWDKDELWRFEKRVLFIKDFLSFLDGKSAFCDLSEHWSDFLNQVTTGEEILDGARPE